MPTKSNKKLAARKPLRSASSKRHAKPLVARPRHPVVAGKGHGENGGAPSKQDWQLAELLVDSNRYFVVWLVSRGTCVTRADLVRSYSGIEFEPLVARLVADGFLTETADGLRVTSLGRAAVRKLGREPRKTAFAKSVSFTELERLQARISECVDLSKSIDPQRLEHVIALLREARQEVAHTQNR